MTYLSNVLADSPRHYWRMADPSGAVARDLGSTRKDLFAINGNAFQMPYTGPNADGGSAFTRPEVFITDGSDALTVPYTFECLAYVLGAGPLGNGSLMTIGAVGASARLVFSSNTLTFTDDANASSIGSSTARSANNWHHLVATFDGSTLLTYVDAVLDQTVSHSSAATTTAQWTVGGAPPGPAGAGGVFLSEVAVYLSALSPTRITAHFVAIDSTSLAPTFKGPAGSSVDLSQILQAVRIQKTTPGQV